MTTPMTPSGTIPDAAMVRPTDDKPMGPVAIDVPVDVAIDVPVDVAIDVPVDVAIDVPVDVAIDVPVGGDVAIDVPVLVRVRPDVISGRRRGEHEGSRDCRNDGKPT